MERTVIKTAINFKKCSRIIIVSGVIIFALLIIGYTENKIISGSQDDNGNINDIIKSVNEYYGGMEQYKGVSMRTEFGVYAPGTKRILVYWENNADEEFTFGESWQLFQEQNGEFIPVFNTVSGLNYGFNSIGYGIRPGKAYKHIYWLEPFTDRLTPGKYQIKTDFNTGRGSTIKSYYLETEFNVSDDKSKWGVSALDFLDGENTDKYRDITGGSWGLTSTFGNTNFRLYRNNQTYGAILTDGIYEYEIEKGSGKWGVLGNSTYEADGKIYFIYAYSSVIADKYSSYLSVLDITDNFNVKEMYKSKPFVSDEIVGISINPKNTADGNAVLDENGDFIMDNRFSIFYEDYTEPESGGYSSSLRDYIGWLVYENGRFFFEEL